MTLAIEGVRAYSEGGGEGASCEGGGEEGLPAGARHLLEILNCPVNVFVICLFEVQY